MNYMAEGAVARLEELHAAIKPDIEARLREFQNVWLQGTDPDIFAELVFCIFTPQSKARTCWAAIEHLRKNDLLMRGSQDEIAAKITGVRFHNTKAERVIKARQQFFGNTLKSTIAGFSSPKETREWLVENVNGLGYKESSHFLRNLGMGSDLAILDRHILKNLVILGIIHKIPASISRNNYLEMEEKMSEFSREIQIPMDHLDLILWYRETGELFK